MTLVLGSPKAPVCLASQWPHPPSIIGKTGLPLTHCGRMLTLEALVVEDLDVDILAETLFMTTNDIAVRHTKEEIIIYGSDTVSYGFSQTSQAH